MGQMPIPASKAAGKQKFESFEPAGFANRLIASKGNPANTTLLESHSGKGNGTNNGTKSGHSQPPPS